MEELKMRNEMIMDYLNLPGGDGVIVNQKENTYICKDQYGSSEYTLEVKNGRIYCEDQDCIETMKSAFDDDEEIMDAIEAFEAKWYR